jgi:hypothetical protein
MAGFLSGLGYNFQPGQMMMGGQTFGSQVMDPVQPMNVQPLNMSVPGVTPMGGMGGTSAGWGGIDGLGMNLDTAKLGVSALGSIAGMWNAFQQNSLAKKSFNHQKGILDTNLANQIKSYNLSVDDKFRSRAVVEGTSAADRDAQIARWSARDERKG